MTLPGHDVTSKPVEDDSLSAQDILKVVRRSAKPAMVAALVLVGAGIAATVLSHGRYFATADVLIANAPGYVSADRAVVPRIISIDTEAARAKSDAVMTDLSLRTGDPDPLSSATVSAYPLTKVMRLTYSADTRAEAQAGANAWAESYVANRVAFLRERTDAVLNGLDSAGVSELAQEGLLASGQRARRAWAVTQANHDARVGAVLMGTPVSASVIRESQAAEREHINTTVWPASGLVVGALLGLAYAMRRTDLRHRDPGRRGTA